MNYDHLRYILKIREIGSISGAAEYSFISQPHLSTIIQSFEDKLGFQIFHRSRSGVVPTIEAEDFFKEAEEVIKHIDEFQDYFQYSSDDVYRLKVAAVPYCYPEETISKLLKEHDKNCIDVYLEYLHSFIIPKRVIDGYFEIGFMSYNTFFKKYIEDSIKFNQMHYVEVAKFTPKLLISKKHPAYDILSKDFTKLKDHVMVRSTTLEEDVVPTYDIFKGTSIKLPKKNYITTNDVFAINYYVANGEAYTINLHEDIYPEWLKANGIESIPIHELGESISMGYIYSSANELSPKATALIKCWLEILKQKDIIK